MQLVTFYWCQEVQICQNPCSWCHILKPMIDETEWIATVFYSKNTSSVPIFKSWRIRLHTFWGQFHLQKLLFCQVFLVWNSEYPTLTTCQMHLVIFHEPKYQIYIASMTMNLCPNFSTPKCQSAQFSKLNLNAFYGFLKYFLADSSKRETLVVSIFLLRIDHEMRFDRVRVCG